MKLRLTFSRLNGRKLNHYLVANSEDEVAELIKKMNDKGFELKCSAPFLERTHYETKRTHKRNNRNNG